MAALFSAEKQAKRHTEPVFAGWGDPYEAGPDWTNISLIFSSRRPMTAFLTR